jgi:hypothetical protein
MTLQYIVQAEEVKNHRLISLAINPDKCPGNRNEHKKKIWLTKVKTEKNT